MTVTAKINAVVAGTLFVGVAAASFVMFRGIELEQQRGLRQFRTRGQVKVAAEFTLAAIAYNVTRLFARQ